ncbi:pre-mRNA-splicing factor 38B isoform X2 [Eupeodes corollae]|nr:pre-mRNA-splicing factor 38B isoform X2 [Eupeodes corollae]
MCGGVRGVGAGGIVSTAFCLLYKLYTLRLTRKQVNGLLNHSDSPYIRALGFMYIRYTQPPADLYDWYEDYLLDEEEIDVKAGGGQTMTIGQMSHQFLTKLDWFSTLFPRIPVPIQKQIEKRLENFCMVNKVNFNQYNVRPGAAPSGARGVPGTGLAGGSSNQYDGEREYVDRGRRDDRDREYYGRGAGSAVGSYRPEHDERNTGFHDYRRPADDRHNRSPSTRDRSERREKHKKKHKHKSRSRSRSRDRYREPSKSSYRGGGGSERDYDSYDRRYR